MCSAIPAKQKRNRKILPRLTGYKRNLYDANVRIEFSAPSSILNNLDELEESDFSKIMKNCRTDLKIWE